MEFRPPDSYTRLLNLGLIAYDKTFWYDVEWCPIMRWVESDPERLAEYELKHPISDYYMFAQTAGGDPWCWQAGIFTVGDEFEVHEVDLFMYVPRAATFEDFVLRQHLEGIAHLDVYKDWWFITKNYDLLDALLSPDVLREVRSIEHRVSIALARGDANPFRWDDYYEVIGRRLGASYGRGT